MLDCMRKALLSMVVPILTINAQVPGQSNDEIEMGYNLSSTLVSLHEPIFMVVTIANHSGSLIRIDLGQDRKEAIRLSITDPHGVTAVTRLPRHEGIATLGAVDISPQGTYKETVVLNEWYLFSETGKYKIKVRLVSSGEEQRMSGLDTSATLPLEILPADPERLRNICIELERRIEEYISYSDAAEAALALSYVDDPVAVPFLQDAATSHSGILAAQAVRGLARADGSAGIRALISLSKRSNPTLTSLARASLSQIMLVTKDPAIKEEIQQALDKQ